MRFLIALLISAVLALHGALIQSVRAEYFGDFESYDVRELNGQDGWSDVWNTLLIDDSVRMNGSKSLSNQDEVAGMAYKEFPKKFVDAGVVSTYVRIENNSFSDNQPLLGLFEGIGEESVAILGFSNNYNDQANMLTLSYPGTHDPFLVGQIQQGVWQKMAIGWRTSDFSIRVKLNDGEWSPWISAETTWGEGGSFGVRLSLPDALQYGKFYLNSLMVFMGEEVIVESIEPEIAIATSTEQVMDIKEITTVTIGAAIEATNSDQPAEVVQEAPQTAEEVLGAELQEPVHSDGEASVAIDITAPLVQEQVAQAEEASAATVEPESISDSLLNIDNLTVTIEF